MSTERTDQYPEVSGEDAGIVPPQGATKAEWPKKIRTLTANELDRLTIDGLGRFYWDGKLVNYEAHPSRIEQKPVDLDQHAMDLLDRTARELTDPNSVQTTTETADQVTVEQPAQPVADPSVSEAQADPTTAPALAATPADQLAPVAPAPAIATTTPVVEMRRQEVMVPSARRSEPTRIVLTGWQSLGLFIVIVGFLVCAAAITASGFVTAHDWGCKVGLVQSYCPPPPPAPMAPPRPDIPA
jgi:hypothetical protein